MRIPNDSLREKGHFLIEEWLPREKARALYASICELPIREVFANTEGSRFGTQDIPQHHAIRELLSGDGLNLVRETYGQEGKLDQLKMWTSAYREGEFIDSHRDREGSVQLLLCLDNSADAGGEVHMTGLDGETVVYSMRPGDAVVFRAREIYHFTTPVRSDSGNSGPLRTVAVGRYFFQGRYPQLARPRSTTPGADYGVGAEDDRDFIAFGVGTPKSGTTSLAKIFARNYRAEREPLHEQTLEILRHHREPLADRQAVLDSLLQRDQSLLLHFEASCILNELCEPLLEVFPQARFVLTIRDCYSWLDSILNLGIKMQDLHGDYRNNWFSTLFTPERFVPTGHDAPLLARGLYPLESYLTYWTARNESILSAVPAEQLLIVKTTEIADRLPQVANFIGVSPASLDARSTHENVTQFKHGVASELDQSYLRESFARTCGDVMSRFYPDVAYHPDFFTTRSSPGELELQRLVKKLEG